MNNVQFPERFCPACFGDPGLEEIIKAHGRRENGCPNCGRGDVVLAGLDAIKEPFRLVADAYEPDEHGETLLSCLKRDWKLFANNALREDTQWENLAGILGEDRISEKYRPFQVQSVEESSEAYQRFRDEIIKENRWFVESSSFIDGSKEFLSNLLYDVGRSTLYRARIAKDPENPYVVSEMGAPPSKFARGGRSNPEGISYLYLASNEATALAEVRPQAGHIVCVGSFEFENLRVVDLTDLRHSYSPFLLEDVSKVGNSASKLALFEAVSEEMSEPIVDSPSREYLPTQYMCEMMKFLGFEGVRYRSSQGDGANFVLFNRTDAKPLEVHHRKVKKLQIENVVIDSTRKII